MQQVAVVVDPLGTGQEYPAAFRDVGVETIAVLTQAVPIKPWRASWHPENFSQVHVHGGDFRALTETLRPIQPLCVVAGAETGVELADLLAEALVPGSGNVPELAAARRDKWGIAQAVDRAGIPALRQFCATDPDEIDKWLHDNGLNHSRIVVKPPRSAGTDDVHIVAPGTDWRPLFDQIYGHVNELELRNDAVLVQEYAEGTEFMVNSYSADGRHGLTDVCRYAKSQRGDRIGVYDMVEFLPPDHPDVLEVWPYSQRVLDAVGIRTGCAHTEVILTQAGPRLIEVGARQAGGGHMMIAELATGSNQILRAVAHRVRGDFRDSYQLIQHVRSVVISAPRAGIWRNAEIFAEVDALPTYWTEHFYHATGDLVPAAASMTSFLGWVVLASTDPQAIEADYRRIKDLERQVQIDPEETDR